MTTRRDCKACQLGVEIKATALHTCEIGDPAPTPAALPPVVRLELPYALELLAILEELELLQDASKKALAKFKQRVLEAESRL